MSETLPVLLSLREMAARWPGEWVLIDQPVLDEQACVVEGRVVFHAPERERVYEHVDELPVPRRYAVEYVGPRPSGQEFLL
jgi:hypothetical protein